jgi:hypothetical protein
LCWTESELRTQAVSLRSIHRSVHRLFPCVRHPPDRVQGRDHALGKAVWFVVAIEQQDGVLTPIGEDVLCGVRSGLELL